MTRYAALLRGVGPVTHPKMPLQDLAAKCSELGLGDAVVVGTTGNLVLASDRSQADIEAGVTSAVRSFGLGNEVFTRTERQLQKLVDLAPFPEAAIDRPAKLGVCFFHRDPAWPAAYKAYAGPERLLTMSNHLIVDYGGQVSLSKLTVEKTVGARMTQRNWSSVLAILARLKA